MEKISEALCSNVKALHLLHILHYETIMVWHKTNILQYLNWNLGNELYCSYRQINYLKRVLLLTKLIKGTVKVKILFFFSFSLLFLGFFSSQSFLTFWKLNCELEFSSHIFSSAAILGRCDDLSKIGLDSYDFRPKTKQHASAWSGIFHGNSLETDEYVLF